jgi:UDP-N-acetylglucosamine 2-epimerase (non-hydrolysing)
MSSQSLSPVAGLRLVAGSAAPADGSRAATVLHAVSGRADAVRLAPVAAALHRRGPVRQLVVHTGDESDRRLVRDVAGDLSLRVADHELDLGPDGDAERMGATLAAFHRLLGELAPDLVVLSGDADATLACALAAARREIAVAHLESGLRSWDWTMPDEVNRVVIDRLADSLFTPSVEAAGNLMGEGVPDSRVHAVGSTTVDALRRVEARAEARAAWALHGLREREYVLAALHRRDTIGDDDRLRAVVDALAMLAARAPVLFCLHPRTRARLRELGELDRLFASGVRGLAPMGYVDFVSLELGAGAIVTDAAAVAEEASALGVACYTLGAVTERPATLGHGTNVLLGDDPEAIAEIVPSRSVPTPRPVPLWDGRAAERVADVLVTTYALAGVGLAASR